MPYSERALVELKVRFLAGSVSKSSRELSHAIIMFGPQSLLQRERTAVSELRLVSLAPTDTVVVGRRIGGTSFPLLPLPGEAPGALAVSLSCLPSGPLGGWAHTSCSGPLSLCPSSAPLGHVPAPLPHPAAFPGARGPEPLPPSCTCHTEGGDRSTAHVS